MNPLRLSKNPERWPRHRVGSVACRSKDLVIRIADWTSDADEPSYDVEVYVGGVYDWTLSGTFSTLNAGRTKRQARDEAVAFASRQISALL